MNFNPQNISSNKLVVLKMQTDNSYVVPNGGYIQLFDEPVRFDADENMLDPSPDLLRKCYEWLEFIRGIFNDGIVVLTKKDLDDNTIFVEFPVQVLTDFYGAPMIQFTNNHNVGVQPYEKVDGTGYVWGIGEYN